MVKGNRADGTISFRDGVQYTQPGTYRYTVTEEPGTVKGISEYDASVYVITVDVTDISEDAYTGKLSAEVSVTKNGQAAEKTEFVNKYNPEEGTYTITGKKNLEAVNSDKTIQAQQFSFVLKDAEGKVLETVKNDAEGNFTFSSLSYTHPGEHTYTVEEVNDGVNGYTYDPAVYTVKVSVKDNKGQLEAAGRTEGEKEIVFNNTYEPHPLVLNGFNVYKNLTGRDLKAGEFSFELVSKDNPDEVLQVKANDKDGNVIFDDMEFVREGKYSYIIREQKGGLGGVTYDQASYDVNVNVTDTNGQLTAIVTYTGSEAGQVEKVQFNNSYKADSTSVKLSAAKTLNGRALKDGEFRFILTDENGKIIETAENDVNGAIDFETLTYDHEGEYIYYVEEEPGRDRNVTYDDRIYKVVVKVTDNEEGSLTPEVFITEDGEEVKTIGFVNAYKAPLPEKHENTDKKDPEGPAKAEHEKAEAPLTGENSNMAGFIILAMLSAGFITAGRKRKEKAE